MQLIYVLEKLKLKISRQLQDKNKVPLKDIMLIPSPCIIYQLILELIVKWFGLGLDLQAKFKL